MGTRGDVWECVAMCGDVWGCVGMCGDVWGCVGTRVGMCRDVWGCAEKNRRAGVLSGDKKHKKVLVGKLRLPPFRSYINDHKIL